jgi:AcrR family transcriptional regulator
MIDGSPTALARHLDGETPARPTALEAFKLARRQFIRGERIEMQALATELGVSRVTLHRWVGTRDDLLGEVIWSLAEPTIRDSRAATRGRGGEGIAETLWRFISTTHTAPFMRQFLEREQQIALRVLTTKSARVQSRVVAAVQDMLLAEAEAGRLELPMEPNDLAYVIVRLAESFTYTDVITGGQPAPDKARRAIAALLRSRVS